MNRDIFILIGMVVLIVLDIPLFVYLGKRFFGTWKGFREAVRDYSSQAPFSILLGCEVHGDFWTSWKLWFYFNICVIVVGLEYLGVFLLSLWLMGEG